MKLFTRSTLVSLLLCLFVFSVAQAQEACGLSTPADYRYAGLDAFWSGNYQQALDLYTCGIALVPDDAQLDLPLDREDPRAGLFLGRAWANTMLGNRELTHADFYHWIELTERETIETSLQLAFSGQAVEMEFGKVYRLSFDANEGESFSFMTESDENTDPLMVLLAPDGTAIASDDDSGGQINADPDAQILNVVLPETGRYRLVISQARIGTGRGEIEIIGDASRLHQSVEACDLADAQDNNARALNLFWEGSYEQALELYNCTIASLPAEVSRDFPRSQLRQLAALYLGRAWTNLMLGNDDESYSDFYQWIVLSQNKIVEENLDLALSLLNPLPMEQGLVYYLRFEGHQGEEVAFSSRTGDAIDPLFVLLAPDGRVLAADDDNGAALSPEVNAQLELVLPEDGVYTLVIGQAGSAGTGYMELIDEHSNELSFLGFAERKI